ncbi:MAG: hypothetical protein GWP42_10815 [Verrucomicrobiales bacterium]|nr:hypothetical protein [Verrucomicrobiales bacterium]|tara:strand:- start:45 stop:1271 length:1227 start_codon:yes stop_codon:yes gene_type:complete
MDSRASPDQTWLIASCPGCSRQIKARKEILLSSLAIECPHCNSPLNLDAGSSNLNEPQYAKAKEQKKNTTEVRRRRRSKKTKLIEWDIEESDSEETEVENESLSDADQNGSGQRRRKRRIRKNKHSKAYHTFTGTTVYIISGGGLILLSAILYKGISTISRDLSGAASNANILNSSQKNDSKQLSTNLTVPERDQCMEVIHAFTNAKTLEDKTALVRHPEITSERIIESIYGPGDEKYERIALSKKQLIDGKYFISLMVKVADTNNYRFFAFEQTLESIKMDWAVSFGHQMMPLQVFKDKRPESIQEFRLNLKSGTYYAHHYSDTAKWKCLEASYSGDFNFKIFVYIDRESAVGKEIITKLIPESTLDPSQTAKERPLSAIVKLRFNSVSKTDNQVELVDLIQDHWFQ